MVNTLAAFGPDEQQCILRWAAEKLGLTQVQVPAPAEPPTAGSVIQPEAPKPAGPVDVKSFVEQKRPKNDSQFAAVVAYFYRFESPEKKDSITKAAFLDACRKAKYPRPPSPGQTLRNAVNAGLLDKVQRGEFSINSVGENLVAVTLPGDGAPPVGASPARKVGRRHPPNRKKAARLRVSAKK